MPFGRVELTRRQGVDGRAGGQGDIGDDETRMMQEVCGMDGVREQAVAGIDKEDEEQGGEQQGAELADGADLRDCVSFGLRLFAGAGRERHLQCDGSWLGAFRHCDSTSDIVPVQCDAEKNKRKKQLWHLLTACAFPFPHSRERQIDTLYSILPLSISLLPNLILL